MNIEVRSGEIISRRAFVAGALRATFVAAGLIVSGGGFAIQVEHSREIREKLKKPNSGYREISLNINGVPNVFSKHMKVYIPEEINGLSTRAGFVTFCGVVLSISAVLAPQSKNELAVEVEPKR
ncbi:MAG: hypothetical protein Q7R44_00380 [bacterium]|nr:hypothetical protein [bacterium]